MVEGATEDWSDSDEEEGSDQQPTQRIRLLEKKLVKAKRELADYQHFISEQLNVASLVDTVRNADQPTTPPSQDDDSHYFESYGENGTGSETST